MSGLSGAAGAWGDTMPSVTDATLACDYREWAANGLAERDWRTTYDAAKGWVSRAGGAWIPEAWLVYAASGLLHAQPRVGVRSVDLGLNNWVSAAPDRSILLWARALITWRYLKDPKTAASDLTSAAPDVPNWLRGRLERDQEACKEAAAISRKRKPSVADAPEYAEEPVAHDTVAARVAGHEIGSEPMLWSLLLPILTNGETSTDD
jgi:hypothetical protein